MAADYELRTPAGAVVFTTPDKSKALAEAERLTTPDEDTGQIRFDNLTLRRVVRFERREELGQFISERAKARERAA